jgi:hypothetical protein
MSTSSAGGIARGRRPVEFDPPICATKPTTSRTAERSSGMGWDGVNGVYGWMVDGRRRRGRAGGQEWRRQQSTHLFVSDTRAQSHRPASFLVLGLHHLSRTADNQIKVAHSGFLSQRSTRFRNDVVKNAEATSPSPDPNFSSTAVYFMALRPVVDQPSIELACIIFLEQLTIKVLKSSLRFPLPQRSTRFRNDMVKNVEATSPSPDPNFSSTAVYFMALRPVVVQPYLPCPLSSVSPRRRLLCPSLSACLHSSSCSAASSPLRSPPPPILLSFARQVRRR